MCAMCHQVMSQYSSILYPICVDAVLRVIHPAKDTNVNLRDIKITQKLGSVSDTEVAVLRKDFATFLCIAVFKMSAILCNYYGFQTVFSNPSVTKEIVRFC